MVLLSGMGMKEARHRGCGPGGGVERCSDGVVDEVGQPLGGLRRGGGGDVGVDVGGDGDGGVAQASADLQQALAAGQAEGGRGVPQVVQPDRRVARAG